MDSNTYIPLAIRTESVPETIQINEAALAVGLKAAIVASQMIDLIKRKIFYGKDIDPATFNAIAQELEGHACFLADLSHFGVDINKLMTEAQNENKPDNNTYDLANVNIRMLHAALGCFTESGELLEAMEKQYKGEPLDKVNFGEEIGDIEWYQAIGFDESGVSEASCREKNIAKLKARYPDKFNNEDAINRDLEAERKTLEDPSDEPDSQRGEDN